jgi:L,D-transpeptidase ErfK/SrfK
MRRTGKPVVSVVPPGPANPLGEYWLRLSLDSIGIHSTNSPSSIYQFTTHGCIRLGPADAEAVFASTELGARGEVIYEPLLMTRLGTRVFLEVHPDVYRQGISLSAIDLMAEQLEAMDLIDWTKVRNAVRAHAGIARDVSVVTP